MFKMKTPINSSILLASVYIFILAIFSYPLKTAYAATVLEDRSIDILSSAGGVNTTHTFSFRFPISINVGSIKFEYCTDPIEDIPCDIPNGLDVTGASLDNQSGEVGFTLTSSTNELILSRASSVTGPQTNRYEFSNMVNPSDIGPFFVRISAYPTIDASGPYLAFSSVAGSIATGIDINGEVPPILYFCSAVSIPTDCSDAVGDFIEFGNLSAGTTSSGTSQFLVGTNAPNGYSVTTNGPTMTSGTDQISAVAGPSPSLVGFSQFGLNLRANLIPLVGAEPVGGIGTVSPNYAVSNNYRYNDGEVVAGATGPTEISLFTVSYIININAAQPAGIYNTTLTYMCTAGF
jgi:hypothetical protein